MWNKSVNYIDIETVVKKEMMFNDIYLELCQPFGSAKWNHLCNLLEGIMRNNFRKLL